MPKRISIVGSPGSGKTTLARALAAQLGGQHIELDSLFHLPGWQSRDRDAFRDLVRQQTDTPCWVADGNYGSVVQDIVWTCADTVVWLDLPRRTVLPALLGRTLWRGALSVELYNGNRERLLSLFDPRPEENIFLWGVTNFQKYRRHYADAMAEPQWGHIRFLRFTSRQEVDRWRQSLRA